MSSKQASSTGRGALRAATGLSDQVLYSLTNFILTVSVARYSPAREFGTYAVVVATFLIASGVNRGLASEPTLIRFSASTLDEWKRAVSGGTTLAFAFGVAVGTALVAVSVLVLPHSFTDFGIVFGIATPALFVQDFLRYAAMARGRPLIALLNDTTVFLVQGAGSVALVESGRAGAVNFTIVWALAGVCGALVGLAALRLNLRPASLATVFGQWDLASRLGIDNLVTQLTQQGTGYLVGAVSGLNATAGLRAGQTLYVPPSTLTLGVQSSVMAELVRVKARSLRVMRQLLLRISVAMAVLGAVYVVLALLCPDRIGTQLFGLSWYEAKPLLLYLGLAQVGGAVANMAVTGLRALADATRTLRARAAGVATVIIAVLPGAILDGGRGASIALAIAGWAQALIWWTFFVRSYQSARRVAASQSANRRWQELVDSPPMLGGRTMSGTPSQADPLGMTRESTAWATALKSEAPPSSSRPSSRHRGQTSDRASRRGRGSRRG